MLFDIRTIIAALLGSYGVILVVTSWVGDTAAQKAKTGGIDINLWAGLAMIAVALAFVVWVFLRPIHTPPPETPDNPDA
ncbi:hypothetical protein D5S18_00565 [Nocardia panacis]|uniref:Uncharacterized protein n=1 Tax=Nocardia panacis TaxID=2340916 RepID=A0A3A4KCK1_9NOCA|nr:hypothetical protein [Nocardia panacis]RJO79808.1 hypothetical protein D5S18_00565 [Nocardia panacis]